MVEEKSQLSNPHIYAKYDKDDIKQITATIEPHFKG